MSNRGIKPADYGYHPPVAVEWLKKYSFLELYPLDGGGSFITGELLGTLDDAEIAVRIVDRQCLAEFGELERLDFGRFERWRTIEKSCWINRCYFVACLAHRAWLAGDRKLADRVKSIMLHFHRHYPPPAESELEAHWRRVIERRERDYNSRSYAVYSCDETDVEYIWFDFQPGSRIINFSYALYLIRELADFTAGEFEELLEGIRRHARVLAAQQRFLSLELDNHQSLRAVALLHALPLMRGEPEFPAMLKLAVDWCEWHVLNEFHPSGALYENSPSYHAFVLWHGRDYLAMAGQLGYTPSEAVRERVAKAARALEFYRRPDGLTLTINDSYALRPDALLESLGHASAAAPATGLLSPGGLAVGVASDCYAAFDVSDFTGKFSHYHGGKNALIAFFAGISFLDDSGCPNYDNPEFGPCKRSIRHSSLLVDGAGDAHTFGLYGFDAWPTVEYGPWLPMPDGAQGITAELTSNAPEWQGVCWRRTFRVFPGMIALDDEIRAAASHRYTLLFNLAPGVVVEPLAEGGFRLGKDKVTVRMEWRSDAGIRWRAVPALNCQTRDFRPTIQLQAESGRSETLKFHSTFRLQAATE